MVDGPFVVFLKLKKKYKVQYFSQNKIPFFFYESNKILTSLVVLRKDIAGDEEKESHVVNWRQAGLLWDDILHSVSPHGA